MIITILAEPRTGSTNLTKWFSNNENFTTLQEPLNKDSMDYKNEEPIKNWMYQTNHLVIKEIYLPFESSKKNIIELFNISDRIILLYRENIIEQLESFLVATQTQKWSSEWVSNRVPITDVKSKEDYFYNMKNEFKKDYLDKNYFKISYEELYYNSGFQKIIDYINLDYVKNKDFPYGSKYKMEHEIKSLI
jgi:LPS sulfotransferase NodH